MQQVAQQVTQLVCQVAIFKINDVVFHFSSSWFETMLHTKSQLPIFFLMSSSNNKNIDVVFQ